MSNFIYEHEGINTYLVYDMEEDDKLDPFTLGMLSHNHIKGIIAPKITEAEGKQKLKFDITKLLNLRQVLGEPVTKGRLLSAYQSIIKILLECEDYLIPSNYFLLEKNCVFSNKSTGEMFLLCFPLERELSNGKEARAFFKNIIFTSEFNPNEKDEYTAVIINYLSTNKVFSLEDFHQFINKLKKESTAPSKPIQKPQTPPVQKPYISSAQPPKSPISSAGSFQNPGEKTAMPASQTPPQKQTEAEPTSNPQDIFHVQSQSSVPSKEKPARQKAPHIQLKETQQQLLQNQLKERALKESDPAKHETLKKDNDSLQNGALNDDNAAKRNRKRSWLLGKIFGLDDVYDDADDYEDEFEDEFDDDFIEDSPSVKNSAKSGRKTKDTPYLIRCKTKEKVYIDKPIFRVGKDKNTVDYPVSDNAAVSRQHADFIIKGSHVYIRDLFSTNHTYINGIKIPDDTETALKDGDRLFLANEEFHFYED